MLRAISLASVLLTIPSIAYGAPADKPVVLSVDDVKAILARLPKNPPASSKTLTDHERYRTQIARVVDRDGPAEIHSTVTDIFVVLAGSGRLMLGGTLMSPREVRPGEQHAHRATGAKEIALAAGTIVEVPANTAHQILAKGTEVSYLVIKIR